VVLSDGTLILPYADFEFRPEKRAMKGRVDCQSYWTVSSSDGGVTFSEPRKVAAQQCNFDDKEASLSGFGKFAADTGSAKYRDRVYFVREDARLGPHRLLFSWSTDRGKTWSPAKPLGAAGIADSVNQFQPAVAVNKEGVLGVTWFDTRDSADGKQYHEYFTASLDGGASFLTPVRVSSAPSNPKGRGNRLMTPMTGVNKDFFVLSLMSAAGWSSGGHYMGLAADKDGDFHAFWVDARSGTSQIYAARVKVDAPSKPDPGAASGAVPAKSAAPAPKREEATLTGKIEMIFDPTSFDADKSEFSVPVRFKNVSKDVIYPPIRMELAGFGYDDEQWKGEQEFWKDKTVEIVNASSGGKSIGAVVDLSDALASASADAGGGGGLAPGAQTNPVVLRIHLSNPDFAPSMRWKATGSIAKTQ
jgi:hypothetical protein